MGKGKRSQNEEEVLGQIFDFIFAQAKKAPDKRRPIKLKPTGVSTSSELTDIVAAALEKPGVFVTDQALSSLNDALSIEFGRMKADEQGENKARFTSSNIIDFFMNPNEFMGKPKVAARKSLKDYAKASFLGRVHQELQANAWAQKYNLDLDAKKAIRGHFAAENVKEQEAGKALGTFAGMQISTSDLNSRKNYIYTRSIDLVGKEMYGRNGWESMNEDKKRAFHAAVGKGDEALSKFLVGTYWGNMDADDKGKMVSILKGAKIDDQKMGEANKILAKYGGKNRWALNAWERYAGLKAAPKYSDIDGKENLTGKSLYDFDGLNLSDVNVYQTLERRNLLGRIEDLQLYLESHPNLSENEKRNIEIGIQRLGQTTVLVSGNLDSSSKRILDAQLSFRRMINSYKQELNDAKRLGDKDKVRILNSKISEVKKGNRELNYMKFWGTIGSWEGKFASVKDVLGENGENGLKSILDGSFYDKDRNRFALPCATGTASFGRYEFTIKDENREELKIPFASKIDFYRSKGGNGLVGLYNNAMTNLYYWTPKSILRTYLVNGEGFFYRAYKIAEKKGLGSILDWEKLASGDKAYIEKLKTLGLDKLSILLVVKNAKLGKLFSWAQRGRDYVKNWMDVHVYRKLRQGTYNFLVKRLKNQEALDMLGKWLGKGGFEVLAKALVTDLLTALGIGVTGGVGSFIAPILSALITDILYDGLKVIIQVVLVVLAGIGGIIWFGIDSGKKSYDSQAYAYTNYAPGEVVTNPNFRGIAPIDGSEENGDMEDFIAGSLPDGVQCLLGASSKYRCTQGPYSKGTKPEIHTSHENVAAIDVGGVDYFYAPSFCGDGNCVITYSSNVTCYDQYNAGGKVTLKATYGGTTYEFSLIHVSLTYGVGTKVSAGQAVARILSGGEVSPKCSSGKHLHLQTKVNGQAVDPQEVMGKSTSDGGFGCSISECPVLFDTW